MGLRGGGKSYSADRSVLDWKLLGDFFLNLKVVVSDVMSPKKTLPILDGWGNDN